MKTLSLYWILKGNHIFVDHLRTVGLSYPVSSTLCTTTTRQIPKPLRTLLHRPNPCLIFSSCHHLIHVQTPPRSTNSMRWHLQRFSFLMMVEGRGYWSISPPNDIVVLVAVRQHRGETKDKGVVWVGVWRRWSTKIWFRFNIQYNESVFILMRM